MLSGQQQEGTTVQQSLPWWVQLCRWLWKLIASLGTLVLLALGVNTLSTWFTSSKGSIPADSPVGVLLAQWPLMLLASLCLLLLALVIWLLSRWHIPAVGNAQLSAQDRECMLRRLRLRYEQMLTQSLQGAVQIELGLTSRPAAIQNAAGLSLRLPDQPEQPLSPHTSIAQAYELAQQELLILGEPGAGKSTQLLELARRLVTQAEVDPMLPLPIVLPLSSWATNRPALQEWLIEQVALLYDVPRRLSQQWVQAEMVLPLLDGLDEMEEAARPDCIAAINAYHRDHLRPLVVCSRSNEYDAAARHGRLALHTSVVVQPLEPKQVDSYLVNLGKPLTGLRAALKTNTFLQELATTPLMLQVLMLTYHGTSVRTLPQKEAQLREQIWTDYVQRMVRGKGDARRYPLAVTTDWLGWLASEMRQHNQAIFSLESLQPDWLPQKQRFFYLWSISLIFGVVVGLFGWLSDGPFAGLISGLLIAALFGLLARWKGGKIALVEDLMWSWKDLLTGLGGGLVAGLLLGAIFGLFVFFVGPIRQLGAALTVGFALGLCGGTAVGVVRSLIGEFSTKKLVKRSSRSPNEGICRSAKMGLCLDCSADS